MPVGPVDPGDETGPVPAGQQRPVVIGIGGSTIPMIIMFFAGQRYFVEGIVTQGGKG
jgi:multiple sugar transport system permease protein